jgi:uncharacterized protein
MFMNHLESSYAGENSVWRYLVVIAAIILVANTIGALPLIIVLAAASGPGKFFSGFAGDLQGLSSLGLNGEFIIMLFPFIAALAAFILLVKPLHRRTLFMIINGTGRIRWNRYFISALLWLLFSALYLFLYFKIDPSNFSINNKTVSLFCLSLLSLLLIPFQAAFEEILFRGYMMQGFAVLTGTRWIPLIITSLLFGLLHSFNPEVRNYGFLTMMPQYVLFGLIFGIITILDDGIEAAMGAHTANNVFLCIMVTNKSSALQTPALFEQHLIYPWIELTGLFLTGILFIYLLSVILGWKNFKTVFKKIAV